MYKLRSGKKVSRTSAVVRRARRIRQRWAATKIQRAFRLRRKRTFNKRVNRAVLSRDPVQYRLFSTNVTTSIPPSPYKVVSQTPQILMNLSDLQYNNENSNLKYCRTSQKIKPMNLHLNFSVIGEDFPYNRVSVALVRHKRSEPIEPADIQGALSGALTTENDRPFLPCTNNTATNDFPNDIGCNMTGANVNANPFVLNSLGWNPKVVDVIKTWNVIVQNKDRLTDGTGQVGVTYPFIREIEYNHKFHEIWKYENRTSPDNNTETFWPYNNKCYQLIAFSDSVSGSSHPYISAHARLSFKDLD